MIPANGWLVDSVGTDVHVVPIGDLMEHTEVDCVCGPVVEPVEGDDGEIGWLISHASLDGREKTERVVTAPETVPVLAPGERTPDQVRDRAGMAGTVLVLAAVVGIVVGVVWAWAGGAL